MGRLVKMSGKVTFVFSYLISIEICFANHQYYVSSNYPLNNYVVCSKEQSSPNSYSWAYTSWTYFRCENGQSCCGNAWNRYCCNKSEQNSWLWANLDPDIAGCLLYGAIFIFFRHNGIL